MSFCHYFTYDGSGGVNSPALRATFSQRFEDVVSLHLGLHPAFEKPPVYTTCLQESWFPLLAPRKTDPLPLVTMISQQRLGYRLLFKYPAWDVSLMNTRRYFLHRVCEIHRHSLCSTSHPLLGGLSGGWGSPRWPPFFIFSMQSCHQPPGPSALLPPSRAPFGFHAQKSLELRFYSQFPLFLYCSQNTSLITEVHLTLGNLTEFSETSGTNTQNSERKKKFPRGTS